MKPDDAKPYLKIGDVARMVGVSPSVDPLLGKPWIDPPAAHRSKYRLYSDEDVKLLKRARFLRRVRGLNAPAIVQLLKRDGLVQPAADGAAGRSARACGSCGAQRGLSLAQVAKAAGISVGFLSALERSQMSASVGTLRRLARFYKTNILDFFDPAESNTSAGASRRSARCWRRGRAYAWNCWHGATRSWSRICFASPPEPEAANPYTHEGEEFLCVLRGELHIALNEEEYRLKPGDSFYFESATPHRWRNPGRTETWVLWVNTPPTF